ncbi:MAG TPA: chaperone modulator CbpM [Saprospiraceae bacterium]|nr:chaperone modulator CbpM [Saprospiraceae bacterium]
MGKENLILVKELCSHYQVEMSLFTELHEFGIIEVQIEEGSYFIHENKLKTVEKILRMRKDLNINLEGIDTVLNLLEKINELQAELNTVKNRLRLYEDRV